MSETLSARDVLQNAKRLMKEKDYQSALRNWMYLKKHLEVFDPEIHWNIAKWYQNLHENTEAIEVYKQVITHLWENEMDTTIFLECLFALGLLEKERKNYSKAMDAFKSFLDYQKKNGLDLPEHIVEQVANGYQECKEIIHYKIKEVSGDSNKNVPYPTGQTSKKKGTLRGRPYQRLQNIPKEEQKEKMEQLWQAMEAKKMDIEEGSSWYIISTDWFDKWKEWTGFSPKKNTSTIDETTTDTIEQESSPLDHKCEEPGRIDSFDILEASEIMLFGEYNLKDNLTEDQDYVIVNPTIWTYLYNIYDGTPILRKAIRNYDKEDEAEFAECIIEVNLVKLYIFEVPREHKQDYYEVMLASRNWGMKDVKNKIWLKKNTKEKDIRLWKVEKPSDLEKFYNELEYEWKKYKTLRIDGELLKDLSILVKDANFSRDDFLMLEYPIPTSNENGYALVEVERKNIHEALNEKASKALKEDESLKDALSAPKTLEFTKIPITLVTNEESIIGACGLSNLGNTCFMNSALQWMSQTVELTKYFLFRLHEAEINHTNVLGSKGRVAEAYGELMSDMWIGSKRKTAPFNVKKSIGTVVAQFRGYNQQDSHEFLHYLIDTLNEDLNRIKEKPYIEIPDSDGRDDAIVSKEQWDAFSKRNDSVMIDIFYGQLKSHLVCLQCDNVSNTFDPFSILSVPVPVVKIVKIKVTFMPLEIKGGNGIRNLEIHINDALCLTEVEKIIQRELAIDDEMLFYIYDSGKLAKRIKQKTSHVWREFAGCHLGAFPYRIDKSKSNGGMYIMDLHMRKQAKKMLFFSGEDQVCNPFVMIIDGKATCRDVKLKIFTYLFPILMLPKILRDKLKSISNEDEIIETAYRLCFEDSPYGEEELYELQLLNNRHSHEGCPSCRKPHKGPCKLDFIQKSYKSFLNWGDQDPEICILWKISTNTDLSAFEKPLKMVMGEPERSKKSKNLSLDLCLEHFRTDEILDDDNKWYWGNCKDHVKARKKMDVYKLPPILIIHLKRFLKNDHEPTFIFKNASRKITELVDFPLKSLDMSEYILGEEEKKEDWNYDLFGVSNHMGKLHGGHYTASWYSENYNRWLYFDDTSVSKLSEKEVVDSSAYILFYRRRGFKGT